ncbi:hypothetical protein Landi51_11736 [Colletotrichum acutatum]
MMQVSFDSPAPPTSEALARPAAAFRPVSDDWKLASCLPFTSVPSTPGQKERPHLQDSNIPPSKAKPTRDVSSEDYLAAASHRCWSTNDRLHINVWCAGPGVFCVM